MVHFFFGVCVSFGAGSGGRGWQRHLPKWFEFVVEEKTAGQRSNMLPAKYLQVFFQWPSQLIARCFNYWSTSRTKMVHAALSLRQRGFGQPRGMLINPDIYGHISCAEEHHKSPPRQQQFAALDKAAFSPNCWGLITWSHSGFIFFSSIWACSKSPWAMWLASPPVRQCYVKPVLHIE